MLRASPVVGPPASIGETVIDQSTTACPASRAAVMLGAASTPAAAVLTGSKVALTDLVHSVIVPRLCATSSAARLAVRAAPTAEFARLLAAADLDAALGLVRTARLLAGSLGTTVSTLLEPAARSLGDLWQNDDCSELEVSVGLVWLQAILREAGAAEPRRESVGSPSVMVVPQPGEAHLLGAAFDAEMLWHAGWDPKVDFPETSAALDALVAGTWVDALDVSLSTSFRREHRLTQLGDTIARARQASLNPDLIVVVSGRVFGPDEPDGDAAEAARGVGADACFASALQAESTIRHALQLPALCA